MFRAILLPVLLALGVLVLAGACGDDDDTATGENDAMSFDREITVRASDQLRFEPDTIRVRAGERIRLVLDNEENTTLHDFSVHSMPVHDVMAEGAEHAHGTEPPSDMALHVAAESGMRGALLFTAGEPGEYEFFCSVPGHADAGMKGKLIVEG